MFPSVVSRAQTLEMLSTGVAGNYDGAIQLVRKISKYSLNSDVNRRFIDCHWGIADACMS